MELRNRSTGAVITDQQFRLNNPNTSFPEVLTSSIINSFGYDPVLEGPQATVIPPYQYSQRDGVINIDGKWFTRYIAGPVFKDYVDAKGITHTAAEQYEAYCFAKDNEQARNIRIERNQCLASCDWTQLPDSPLSTESKTAWAVYREDLRNITSQAGFPWNIQWPTKPDIN
jgi:hypothetical protein